MATKPYTIGDDLKYRDSQWSLVIAATRVILNIFNPVDSEKYRRKIAFWDARGLVAAGASLSEAAEMRCLVASAILQSCFVLTAFASHSPAV